MRIKFQQFRKLSIHIFMLRILLIVWSHMHTCTHARMRTHKHTYAYIHASIHPYIHACMHTCIHADMHTCIHAFMHTCLHTYRHTDIHKYVHTYIPYHTVPYRTVPYCTVPYRTIPYHTLHTLHTIHIDSNIQAFEICFFKTCPFEFHGAFFSQVPMSKDFVPPGKPKRCGFPLATADQRRCAMTPLFSGVK